MYNVLTTSGQSCVQTMCSYHAFIFDNSRVYNTPYLYRVYSHVIHRQFPSFSWLPTLLQVVYTRYTHSLLLKLLIYLKKGY